MSLENLYRYECEKLLAGVDLFRNLLPHVKNNSSIHSGEEGRFVENLVSEFLKNSLPTGVEVGTGFIISSKDTTVHSGQTDIIIYDNHKYSPVMKYGDAVVVHDKAVIGAISVKKNITRIEITSEVEALTKIGAICGKNGQPKPYLAIFSLDIIGLSNFNDTLNDAVTKLCLAYPERTKGWSENEMISDIIVVDKFIIKKKEWKDSSKKEDKARYILCGGNGEHRNIYVQHLVHGIGKVINKRGKYSDSVLTNFPKLSFKQVAEFNLCTEDRPYSL